MPHTGPCGGKRGSILDCLSPRLGARGVGESIVKLGGLVRGVTRPPSHHPTQSPPGFVQVWPSRSYAWRPSSEISPGARPNMGWKTSMGPRDPVQTTYTQFIRWNLIIQFIRSGRCTQRTRVDPYQERWRHIHGMAWAEHSPNMGRENFERASDSESSADAGHEWIQVRWRHIHAHAHAHAQEGTNVEVTVSFLFFAPSLSFPFFPTTPNLGEILPEEAPLCLSRRTVGVLSAIISPFSLTQAFCVRFFPPHTAIFRSNIHISRGRRSRCWSGARWPCPCRPPRLGCSRRRP